MKKPASSRRKAVKKTVHRTRKKTAVRPESVSETCLHKHCQQWLEQSGIWNRLLIFHVPNERKGSIGAIMHFKRMGVRSGVADYLAFPTYGTKAAIELKDENGEQREDQEKFQAKWERTGGIYYTVRTLEDFQHIVTALDLFA